MRGEYDQPVKESMLIPLKSVRIPATILLASVLASCGGVYNEPLPPPTYPPPPVPVAMPEPLPEPYTPAPQSTAQPGAPSGAASAPAPPVPAASPVDPALVRTYPTGQWVYVVDHGWIWVPAGSTAEDMEGIPYVFLFTPMLGWTWYVSPWGPGPYYYGIWFRHPWHPVGWHGYWVAHPRAIDRLGPIRRRR
jgi:hypothetical protein